MKTIAALLILLACAMPSRAEGIVQVLNRSNELRLAAWAPASPDSARGHRLKEVFAMLVEPNQPVPELRLVTGNVVAETLLGQVVVVNEIMGDLPLPQLIFLLGHELGHVQAGHWAQLVAVYQRLIPGEVTKAQTDAVAGELGAAASALAHRQELEADLHGLKVLQSHGYTRDDAIAFVMGRGLYFDTATHPGTRKRLGHLREAGRAGSDTALPETAAGGGL